MVKQSIIAEVNHPVFVIAGEDGEAGHLEDAVVLTQAKLQGDVRVIGALMDDLDGHRVVYIVGLAIIGVVPAANGLALGPWVIVPDNFPLIY